MFSATIQDLAFSEGVEKMLASKELKAKKKEIEEIEAEWSKAFGHHECQSSHD